VDLELRGKKVLITGASKGIGLACVHGFAAEGARGRNASEGKPQGLPPITLNVAHRTDKT
jgi:NAD(P)-dependent dehydrogenase (short-subunit alcohol dehydrogenase family)